MLHQLESMAGEIQRIEIPKCAAEPLPGGWESPEPWIALVIYFRDGHKLVMERDHAEAVLNDGFLTRQQIAVTFL
jgi:hypothetical protein